MTRAEAAAQTRLFQRRVKLGMKWLDENRVGWLDKIDLRQLWLRNGDYCVMGQVDGSFDSFVKSLGLPSYTSRWVINRGFNLPPKVSEGHGSWERLNLTWVEAIARRFHADTVAARG